MKMSDNKILIQNLVNVIQEGLPYTEALKDFLDYHHKLIKTLERRTTALENIKNYHEVSKGDMYRRNYNWITANAALQMPELGESE
jgi:hypothetical protein